jgi:hypothetical protein
MKTKSSNNANQLQELTGNKVNDKERILEFLSKHYYINIETCISFLDMKHQTASARLSDLHDEGKIDVSEGETCIYYKLSENPEKVKQQREKLKIDGLIKKLESYGYVVSKK